VSKSYKLNAEESFSSLTPLEAKGEKDRPEERDETGPLRGARLISIERIQPDPNQPRKTFPQAALESLAESIKEIGGIIDPLTVAYVEQEKVFRIISGERRYRAARIAGLEKLPCIIKEADEKKTLLVQLISNLQREDMTPLEEAAGVRGLVEKFGYSQSDIAKLLNKSQSYISQILGLERLTQPAREILQTSEVAKEVQIRASKEKDPEKQSEILKKASDGKTVRQIRLDSKAAVSNEAGNQPRGTGDEEATGEIRFQTFRKWTWKPEDGRFVITIQYSKEQSEGAKIQSVRSSLEEALKWINGLTH
jgi:ParB family transcriptional regulator, chromosome partitioning protein